MPPGPPALGGRDPRRIDLDGQRIIDRFANMLADSAAYTPVIKHLQSHCSEVHLQCMHRALRHTGMTALTGRTDSMGHRSQPHPDLRTIDHREQGVGRAGLDAGGILAEIARHLIGIDDRSTVSGMEADTVVGAGFGAILAARASFHKERVLYGSGRAKKIRPSRGGGHYRLRLSIALLLKLVRRPSNRDDRVLEKLSASVFVFGGHDACRAPSPTSRRRHEACTPRRTGHRHRIAHPSRDGSRE